MTNIESLGSIVRRLIKWVAGALAAWFTWVQIESILDLVRSHPLDPALERELLSFSPEVARRVIIAFYYICWVAGTTFDTDVQQNVYIWSNRKKGDLLIPVALIILFGAIAALLLWSASDDQRFAICLDLFFLANIAGFCYILYFVRPIIAETHLNYRGNNENFNEIRLEFVSNYMNGNWQWLRFASGVVLIAFVNLISFSVSTRANVASLMSSASDTQENIKSFLPTIFFFVFVAAVEGWIWYMRAWLKARMGVLDDLEGSYVLERRLSGRKRLRRQVR